MPGSETIETYYLIDYENVHENNFPEKLENHIHIHLFCTENASQIRLNVPQSLELKIYKVPAGKQSLDMHLVAYLGYLIGTNGNKKCKYVIVSRDTGYQKVVSFLKKQRPVEIICQTGINPESQNNANKNSVAARTASTAGKNSKTVTAAKQKTELNTKIQKAVSNAGYKKSDINKIASIVVKHYGEDKFAMEVHNELRKIYPNYYSDIYKVVKPIITQYTSAAVK